MLLPVRLGAVAPQLRTRTRTRTRTTVCTRGTVRPPRSRTVDRPLHPRTAAPGRR
ncbi:hypothetical protein [Streptomyces sp. NPDC007063]|uniref:hypothetical protein n=1 Tax=Streptomyces sp. NPDC007063 TaxID=3364772 RepID=UPI0036844DC5